MENASKALIIAGAILLSILIIGLGMMVFNQAKDALTGASLSAEKVGAFNSKYETYIRNGLTGIQVRSLIDAVKNNNLTADNADTFVITIQREGGTPIGNNAVELNNLKNQVRNGGSYNVTATYNGPGGIIDTITISGTFNN